MKKEINEELYEKLKHEIDWNECYTEIIINISALKNIESILLRMDLTEDLHFLLEQTNKIKNKLEIDLNTYNYYSSNFCTNGCDIG